MKKFLPLENKKKTRWRRNIVGKIKMYDVIFNGEINQKKLSFKDINLKMRF